MKPPALNFSDSAEVRRWLDDVATTADDLAAAAEDQIAPVAERALGQATARGIIADAGSTLRALVALARAGLPAGSSDPDATPIPD